MQPLLRPNRPHRKAKLQAAVKLAGRGDRALATAEEELPAGQQPLRAPRRRGVNQPLEGAAGPGAAADDKAAEKADSEEDDAENESHETASEYLPTKMPNGKRAAKKARVPAQTPGAQNVRAKPVGAAAAKQIVAPIVVSPKPIAVAPPPKEEKDEVDRPVPPKVLPAMPCC